jgi:hypothetical protein
LEIMSANGPPIVNVADPHGLLTSGEPTARLHELAAMFEVSSKALRIALESPFGDGVRFARCKPARVTRYAVEDVRAVVEQHRLWFDERRRRAAELEISQRAARAEKTAANEAKARARHAARRTENPTRGHRRRP